MNPLALLRRSFLVAVIAAAHPAFAQDRSSDTNPPGAALISRDRIGLNLDGAELIVEAAKKKAVELKVAVNIAVVDNGGHLLAFARMDNARPASVSTALTKAIAAATTRQPTGPSRGADGEPNLLLSLSLQNAAAASGGKMTSLLGGIPIVVDGQVIGAVGVGGATGEQDAEVAKVGIEQVLEKLRVAPTR